jgi:predicted nucleotidyltransferase
MTIPNLAELLPAQPEWLCKSTIFLTRYGSHAYGTNTPSSDLDIRGVAIPPSPYFLGFSRKFEQAIRSAPYDTVVYDIRKFMNLAMDGNPSIIEILWVHDSDVLYSTEEGEQLRAARELFLSQKIKHTFSGYAISQLKRIQTHRKWLLDPPKAPPTRQEYGLMERRLLSQDQQGALDTLIQKTMSEWDLDLSDLDESRRIYLLGQIEKVLGSSQQRFQSAGHRLGFDENFLDYLDREKRYSTAQRQWEQYNTWKKERNPDRAALEEKFGLDCKHASHLVRLLRMCREILETGQVIVRRPDAEELLAIRNGAWSYEQIVEFAEREDKCLDEVKKNSKLPKVPDRDWLDNLCQALVRKWLF